MPSTYSSSLRAELQASGENDSTWGDKANTNFGVILEEAIAGIATITMADTDRTLSVAYGATDEARKMILQITGIQTTPRNVIVPPVSKVYVVNNITSGGFAVTIKTQSGSGVSVANGDTQIVFCDGGNVNQATAGTSSGSITPASVSATPANWRFDGVVSNGRADTSVTGVGKYTVDGTISASYDVYFKGVLAGRFQAEVSSGGVLTGLDINGQGYPVSLSINGSNKLQVATDGNVDIAQTLTAAALISTGTVTANGNITAFSDERVKHGWMGLPVSFTERLADVKYGTYQRTDEEGDKRYVGVSAQSLQKLLPEAVEQHENGMLSVAYGNAALVSSIQLAKEFGKMRDIGAHLIMHFKKMQDKIVELEKKIIELQKGL